MKRNGHQPESNMEFRDIDGVVFIKFHKEWNWKNNMNWYAFINSKNLGIDYFYVDAKGITCYLVKDEKKWALNKIKYGI